MARIKDNSVEANHQAPTGPGCTTVTVLSPPSISVRKTVDKATALPGDTLAEEQVIDTVRIDRGLLKGGREVFGLKVHGDSMVEAGILSGDYIFVKKQLTVPPGHSGRPTPLRYAARSEAAFGLS